ncbi:MAG TPA: hypothetical protein VHQ70_09185, partial [Syntrophomonadaceae bacterium]|nr:hypothetical protein [Syntrophomonadaceae bacterium]
GKIFPIIRRYRASNILSGEAGTLYAVGYSIPEQHMVPVLYVVLKSYCLDPIYAFEKKRAWYDLREVLPARIV